MQNHNSKIKTVELKYLFPHPDNPNRMSKENFRKLKRHIERTGRYEPVIVRPKTTQYAVRDTQYEIINGHHRVEVLKQLGYEKCDCVVWDVDDDEARLLLATLNRLSGNDILEKKTALLEKLNAKYDIKELSKLLPNTKPQIQRLIELNKNKLALQISEQSVNLPNAIVFFLNNEQKKFVEKAVRLAPPPVGGAKLTKAQRNALAITHIAKEYIERIHNEENQLHSA
ncbi:MAG: ParB N-terminal domain-containing protein [Sedimentisphaerales bacterium]|nr:ParB N-terminal domain-containing protein [Sedimentisphaerales bacterium]